MGFKICYLASKNEPEAVVRALGLEIAASAPEMPDGSWWTARLRLSEWTLLWSEDETFGQISQEAISALSASCDVILCEVNETTMRSSAECWRQGQQVWRLTHHGDGDDGFDLSEAGVLPDDFSEIKNRHFEAQRAESENVDHIFEIPLDLAASRIGFRHETTLEADDVEAFFILTKAKKKGFLSRIFGS